MICLSLQYYDFDSASRTYGKAKLPKSSKKVHALHWWADSLKTHERDAIPRKFKGLKTLGMTQLSLTVSSNSPKNFKKRKAF
jgi:hypothetical protein